MEEINNQIKNSELLAGKVLGSLNEAEQKTLHEWEQMPGNRKLAEDILNPEAFTAWKYKLRQVDTEKEWKSFLAHMEGSTDNRAKVIRLKVVKWAVSVAAIFILGIAVFSLYEYSNPENNYQTVEASTIAPGSSNAELVLSDGAVVNLEQASKNKINEGEVLAENNDGVLQYTNSKEQKEIVSKTNTLKVPRGGEYQLVLSDGTKVWLNSETELTYSVPFVGKERRVSLKGEAYFDVAPNKDMPFIVASENQEIRVLGTEFNVSAYPSDANVVSTLVEGKVQVRSTQAGHLEFLSPNQQSIFNKTSGNMNKRTVDVYPYIAWKDGRFVLNNVTLEDFLSKMSRWYNVEVVFNDESLKSIKFSGDLPRYNDMTSILKIIEAEMSVNIKVEDNKKIHVFK
ncbi:FecR domain-containing protein [Flavobacteriaceae bacterium SZ-1-7]|uniref:FecR family protein n=1 Tax=Tamlana sedimenti TaxID=3134126 RepID=UPI00312312B1